MGAIIRCSQTFATDPNHWGVTCHFIIGYRIELTNLSGELKSQRLLYPTPGRPTFHRTISLDSKVVLGVPLYSLSVTTARLLAPFELSLSRFESFFGLPALVPCRYHKRKVLPYLLVGKLDGHVLSFKLVELVARLVTFPLKFGDEFFKLLPRERGKCRWRVSRRGSHCCSCKV